VWPRCFAAGARRVTCSRGFRDVAGGFADAVAAFLGFTGRFLAFAGLSLTVPGPLPTLAGLVLAFARRCLACTGRCRAFAARCRALAGRCLSFAGRCFAFAGLVLACTLAFTGRRPGFAPRFFIVNLQWRADCRAGRSSLSLTAMPPSRRLGGTPSAQPRRHARRTTAGHPRADAIIRPMPEARGGVEFLRSCPVLAALPVTELDALATVARDQRYRARDVIFMEGDPALWFCLVKTGRVRIFRQSRSGKEVVLELLGRGEPFGGVAVIEKRPYPASAQATEPSVITKLPQDAIVALAERDPSIIKAMALMIGRRLRAAHDSVTSLATDPVEARLAATVLRLAEREGARGPHGVTLPFHLTRQGLADMTGTTVETAIRIVSRWLKDGLVREDESRLALVELAALRDLAEGQSD
jgi:CRP-like cAMP-binding protein